MARTCPRHIFSLLFLVTYIFLLCSRCLVITSLLLPCYRVEQGGGRHTRDWLISPGNWDGDKTFINWREGRGRQEMRNCKYMGPFYTPASSDLMNTNGFPTIALSLEMLKLAFKGNAQNCKIYCKFGITVLFKCWVFCLSWHGPKTDHRELWGSSRHCPGLSGFYFDTLEPCQPPGHCGEPDLFVITFTFLSEFRDFLHFLNGRLCVQRKCGKKSLGLKYTLEPNLGFWIIKRAV